METSFVLDTQTHDICQAFRGFFPAAPAGQSRAAKDIAVEAINSRTMDRVNQPQA